MTGSDRPEPTGHDGVDFDAKPACMALVPLAPPVWSPDFDRPKAPLTRPDSTFVTHLIATAEKAPQTRHLRRATLADARSAYSASQHPIYGAGVRTRQII
jgi:hypothetical protein